MPNRAPRPQRCPTALKREVSLAEALDRVLHKGAVVVGDMVISVAQIDLLYLGVNLILTSVDTVQGRSAKSHAKKLHPRS